MVIPELNKVAVWRPINGSALDVKKMQGYPYMFNNKRQVGVVQRYAKNYEVDDKMFSLILVSTSEDEGSVENFLDKVAPGIESSQCNGDLHKTNILFI